MATPASQKGSDRPISFVLVDSKGVTTQIPLVIRPEDLTRNEPSLMTPTQTLGGAFLDDFGRGIATIQISGHTGWNLGAGWEQEFTNIREKMWLGWHKARRDALTAGKSPDTVRLIFVDALDSIVSTVAPEQFTLRRSRARPLYMQYSLTMKVLSDKVQDPTVDPLKLANKIKTASDIAKAGDSLQASINKLVKASAQIRTLVSLATANPAAAFMSLASGGFSSALNVISGGATILGQSPAQLINAGRDIANVGRNAFLILGAVDNLTRDAAFEVSQIAGAFENASCIFTNAFRQWPQYPDYAGLYGSSGCSSTIGGSPLSAFADSNTFETFIDSSHSLPAISGAAATAMTLLRNADPVLAPMGLSALLGSLNTINSGVMFQ